VYGAGDTRIIMELWRNGADSVQRNGADSVQ
jgi:hypothetical protein